MSIADDSKKCVKEEGLMMKKICSFLCLALIILGGCQMNNESKNPELEAVEEAQEDLLPQDMPAEDLPQVEAFQDEFTRSFLQSTEETRPDYYPFLSNTGAFEMDLYKESRVNERSYSLRRKGFEMLRVTTGNQDSQFIHNVTITYTGHLTEEIHKKTRLQMLRQSSGEDLEFERIEQEDQIIYIGPYELNPDGPAGSESYGYGAFIFNNLGRGGIEVKYGSNCYRNCDEEREKDQAAIYDWILNGIRFVDSNEAGEQDGE